MLCWDINCLIEVAVECSRTKVLDVVLPYRKITPGKYSQYFLGRYIFSNGKLLGIRLATCAPNSLTTKYYCSTLNKATRRNLSFVPIW
jgi:hypothetical protein